ncbi:MAG: hypothetical protein FJW69_05860, partial [Actinobacteria bacterium]|nr:hypothetical protein [Actinomycetota bacterium]
MDNTSIKNNQKNNHFLFYSATITINTIFGLQILNSYVSLLNNFLRERPNISLIQVGIYAIVTFMLVFLAGILFMIFTKKALILLFAAGLCAVRLIIQVNSWAPLSLAASALGTVLWMVSIVFFISLVQEKKISLFYEFFPALFLGFAATTGIYGMFGTWDLIWQDNAASYFLVFSFAAAYLWLTVKISPDFGKSRQYFDGGMNVFYTLIVFMPFVFLQLYRFQNIAALSAVLGFNTLTGFAVIAATNILTFSIIYLFVLKLEGSKNVSSWLQNLLTAAAFLMAVLSFWPEAKGG